MKVDLELGDVLIKRAHNGWMALTISEADPTYVLTDVYSDSETDELGTHESLAELLWDHFCAYFRSKWHGGITLKIEEKGREHDDQ